MATFHTFRITGSPRHLVFSGAAGAPGRRAPGLGLVRAVIHTTDFLDILTTTSRTATGRVLGAANAGARRLSLLTVAELVGFPLTRGEERERPQPTMGSRRIRLLE